MAEQVKAWRAEDGSLHDEECAAATRNVELLVERSPLSENQPYARDLVKWLTENSREIRAKLEVHERACPKDVVAAEAIPEGFYYCHEHAKFYSTATDRVMGPEFTAKWRDRQAEFPQSAEEARGR